MYCTALSVFPYFSKNRMNRFTDLNVFRLAIHDLACDTGTFVKLDYRHDIRYLNFKRVGTVVDHGIGHSFTFPGKLDRLHIANAHPVTFGKD